MKEEWKVFVRGVEGRGDEVIKTLTGLGANKPPFDIGGDPSYIYYISHDGDITCVLYDSESAKIIMDNYRELKLPEKWKDGDILFSETDNEFAVFKHECKINSISTDKFFCHLITYNGLCSTYQVILKIDFRLATKSEVTQFHERLHKIKKDWDAEKKQLVDWRWKPNEGYYCIHSTGTVHSCTWLDDGIDNSRFSIGNCFKTKEEAETMAEKVKKLLKGE